MVNVKNAIAFGLLAATASAASLHNEKRHHGHKRHHPKPPCTTGTIPYPVGNSTTPAGTGTGAAATTTVSTPAGGAGASSSPSVVTVSVIPVPVSPSSVATSTPVAATSQQPGGGSSPAGGPGPTCGVATTYVTVQQTVTVTAGQAPPSTSSTSTSSTVSAAVVVPSSSPVDSAPAMLQTGTTTTPAKKAAATSPAPVSTSAASQPVSGGYTGSKMGASWIPGVPFSSLNIAAPWAYDWGQVGDGIPSGTEYVPTLHDSSKCAGFASQLAGQSGISYVKHFNEPDMQGGGGSGLSVGEAASLHNQYIAPLASQYKLGLPAVTSNNIPGTSGTGWLEAFVAQVGCKDFSFADFHFYGGSEAVEQQAQIFLGYVENWVSVVDQICPGQNLPIWITEFSAGPVADGDAGKASAFMNVAGPALEKNARVARYSYFFPANNQITSAFDEIASALKSVGL